MFLHFTRLKKATHIWLLGIVFLFTGCYTYRVATQAQAGTEVTSTVTAHAYFWGLLKKPPNYIHTPVCDSLGVNGLSEVTIKSNFGYAFITVATLGIWSPIQVQWKCSKPCKKTETL